MNSRSAILILGQGLKNKIRSLHFTNLVWMLGDKGFKLFMELFVGLFVARHLGVELFGLLNFAISYVAIFYGFSSLGLSELLTRELISFKFQQHKTLGSSLFLKSVVAILFIVGINISTYLIVLNPEGRLLVFIISWSIFWKAFDVTEYYFQAKVAFNKIGKVHISSNLLVSLFKTCIISANLPVLYFGLAYMLEWFFNAIGFYLLYSKEGSVRSWRFDKAVSMILLRNSWYLILSAFAVGLYMKIDQLMIREMINDVANGYYAAAAKVSELWYTVPVVVCSVLFPALLNAKKESFKLYRHRMLLLFSLMFWSSTAFGIIFSVFPDTIISVLYGADYQPAGKVLTIHVWTGIFVAWGVCTTYWLLAENLQHISLLRTMCSLFANIILNFVLIPVYGISGAALATLLSQMVASSLSLLIFRQTRVIFSMQIKSIFYPYSLMRNNS